ncbi:MAG: CHAD domain-containing protein [Bacteroidota bacterium]
MARQPRRRSKNNLHARRRVRKTGPPSALPVPSLVLARALQERTQKFAVLAAQLPSHRSSGTVHDLRVATRRLIAAIDLVRPVLSQVQVDRMRRRLRRLLRSFGPLRDLEIQKALLGELVRDAPALRPVLRRLTLAERQLLTASVTRIRQFDRTHLEQIIADVLERLRTFERIRSGEIALLASARSERAHFFLAVLRARSQLDRDNVRSVHALRIAMKKFRYATEILAPFEAGISRRDLKAMNALQLLLGEVQDWTITIDFLAGKPIAGTITKPGALIGILESATLRRTAILERALPAAEQIPAFWDGRV